MKSKGGRRKRPRSTAEKLLLVEVSEKLGQVMKDRGWNAETAAKELGVSRASFYRYWKHKDDLPGFEVLQRAHDLWDLNFTNIDFGAPGGRPEPARAEEPKQYVLPFIKAVREEDVEVVKAKSIKPDTLQLTVNIKFVG